MAKPAKRRRKGQQAKPRVRVPPAAGDNPVAQGRALLQPGERESVEDPLEDFPEDERARDAWLLDRQAEDIQRDGH